jgi:hypothetical protein
VYLARYGVDQEVENGSDLFAVIKLDKQTERGKLTLVVIDNVRNYFLSTRIQLLQFKCFHLISSICAICLQLLFLD